MSGFSYIIINTLSIKQKEDKYMNKLSATYLIIFSFLLSIFLVEVLIFSSFISNEINKRKKEKNVANYYYNNQSTRFFITGDKQFDKIFMLYNEIRPLHWQEIENDLWLP